MKKGDFAISKLVAFLIVLAILIILAAFVIPRIESFKEIFAKLLESFK